MVDDVVVVVVLVLLVLHYIEHCTEIIITIIIVIVIRFVVALAMMTGIKWRRWWRVKMLQTEKWGYRPSHFQRIPVRMCSTYTHVHKQMMYTFDPWYVCWPVAISAFSQCPVHVLNPFLSTFAHRCCFHVDIISGFTITDNIPEYLSNCNGFGL